MSCSSQHKWVRQPNHPVLRTKNVDFRWCAQNCDSRYETLKYFLKSVHSKKKVTTFSYLQANDIVVGNSVICFEAMRNSEVVFWPRYAQ